MQELLTVNQASQFLNVHPNTIRNWNKQGEIPYTKIGRRYYIKKKELEEHLDKRSYKPLHKDLIPKLKIMLDGHKGCDKVSLKGDSGFKNKKSTRCNCGVGSVYPRTTKQGYVRWYVDYFNTKGERVQHVVKNAQTQDDAIHALLKDVQDNFQREHKPKQRRFMQFEKFAEIYLLEYAMVAKESAETDEHRLKSLRAFFKDVEISEITPMMIQNYRASRLKANIAKSTINREVALLKKMFSLAVEEGYLEQNPAKKIKMFSELDTVRDRVLSSDEEERLFSELTDRVKSFVLAALHTGIRYRKLLALRWSDVNLAKGFIKVEKTKSKKARYIPINSLLREELSRLKSVNGKEKEVFPFKSVRTAFMNACSRAGVDDFTFHDLRRTFGTRLLERGVDIVTISRLYGHSSVLVTQRYLHPKDELSREAVELLVEKPMGNVDNLLHECDMGKTDRHQKGLIN